MMPALPRGLTAGRTGGSRIRTNFAGYSRITVLIDFVQ